MKRFVISSLLKKLPLLIILTVVLCSIAIFSTTDVSFIMRYNIYDGVQSLNPRFVNPDPAYLGLTIFFFATMMLLPLFSMNYRYSLAKSDVYRQVAFKEKHIRYAEHLSTLVTVLISFTVAYIILVGSLAVANTITVASFNKPADQYGVYTAGYYNYIYYIPLYFCIIVLGVAQYFISYLIVSRSNCVRNSVIVLILGELALMSMFFLINDYIDNHDHLPADAFIYTGASVAFPIFLLYRIFTPAILYNENWFVDLYESRSYTNYPYAVFTLVTSAIIFLGLAVLGLIAFIKEKDPSGEFAGKTNTKKPYQEIIFHVGFALFGLFITQAAISMNVVSYLLFLVFFAAAYYSLYGTLIHNFKLKPYQIGILVSVMVFVILVGTSGHAVKLYYENR